MTKPVAQIEKRKSFLIVVTVYAFCSTMRGHIKGTARSINSICRTTVLYFLVVRKYSTLFKYKAGKTK